MNPISPNNIKKACSRRGCISPNNIKVHVPDVVVYAHYLKYIYTL